jgi:hypothetical protein
LFFFDVQGFGSFLLRVATNALASLAVRGPFFYVILFFPPGCDLEVFMFLWRHQSVIDRSDNPFVFMIGLHGCKYREGTV